MKMMIGNAKIGARVVANLAVTTGLLIAALSLGANAATTASFENECRRVARLASRATGVPESVLYAISLTETGRKRDKQFSAWPWTVNMEGRGVWFDTEQQARSYVLKEFKRGARSFDVGCFQLNYKWHGQAFKSIRDMFDPMTNALYAANFLRELYLEKGNWSDAAGAYHSRTPQYANRYKARFDTIHARIAGTEAELTPIQLLPKSLRTPSAGHLADEEVAENNFPLLQGSSVAQSNMGSLFPDTGKMVATRLLDGG